MYIAISQAAVETFKHNSDTNSDFNNMECTNELTKRKQKKNHEKAGKKVLLYFLKLK